MKKRLPILFILFLFLILLSYSVTGDFDYNETGNYDNYFLQGTGFFNDNLASYTDYLRSLSSISKQTPLVNDLDGDGTNEIIVLDGGSFRLYNGNELSIVDAYNLPMNENVSNFITYNIDGDNYTEIIVATEVTEMLYILEYNGTSFYNESSYDLSGINHTSGEYMIKCGDIDKCLLVVTTQEQITGVATLLESDLYAVAFNSTGLSVSLWVDESATSTGAFCLPKIRTMAYVDYDNDGIDEYIFSAIDLGTGDEDIFIYWISVLANNTPVLEQIEEETRTGDLGGTGCVGGNIGRAFTSPLVFDVDGSSSNGLETVIGAMIDDDEFKMWSYKSDGSNLDDYPEVWDADGVLISNVIRANAFVDSGNDDFCVMGYDDEDNELNLLCASEQATYTSLLLPYESAEFIFDTSSYYNITQSYNNWNSIIHSAQHSTATTDGNNLAEVINSYGVLALDWDTVYRTEIPPILSLDLIFENPHADAVVISVDAEKVGRDDLLVLTSGNLYYIDDEWENSPAEISEYSVNPCLDSTWQTNTSVEVRMKIEDAENDDVAGKVILYKGDDNEQNSTWSINVSSGTWLSFMFSANKTIAVGVLELYARDTENPLEEDVISLSFSVNPTGVEYGDCITEVDIITEEEEIEGGTGADCDTDSDCADDFLCVDSECVAVADSGISLAMDEWGGMVGLSKNVLWLLLMVFVAVIIWIKGDYTHGSGNAIALGVIMLAEVLLLILGVKLNFISIGVLISLIVVAIVIVALIFRKLFFGGD